ncbi:hypothetical protein [Paenibacillus sp. USDA918EY]|nr:hypothetical protein [Paenibacillus sp. USDA918EY]
MNADIPFDPRILRLDYRMGLPSAGKHRRMPMEEKSPKPSSGKNGLQALF